MKQHSEVWTAQRRYLRYVDTTESEFAYRWCLDLSVEAMLGILHNIYLGSKHVFPL